jgi:hypothetical protein
MRKRHGALWCASLLAVLATTMTAIADEPPRVPEGGLIHDKQEACTDHVFGLQGTCYYSRDQKNNRYVAFYTLQEIGMVIWQIVDGELVEVWRRSPDV